MLQTKSTPATDSATELRELVGDDATAEFETDPKFIDSNPTSSASSENLAARDTDDAEDDDEDDEDENDEDEDDDEDDVDEDEDDEEYEDDEDEEDEDEEDDDEDDEDEVGALAA